MAATLAAHTAHTSSGDVPAADAAAAALRSWCPGSVLLPSVVMKLLGVVAIAKVVRI